jgi:hypothetical protein
MSVCRLFKLSLASFLRTDFCHKALCPSLVLSFFLPLSAFAGVADEVPVPAEAAGLLSEQSAELVSAEEADEMVKVAVMPVQVEENAAGRVPDLIDDYLLTAVQNLGGREVIGQDDIEAVLGLERQKDLLGCTKTNCFSELSGALGVEKLVLMRIGLIEAGKKKIEWVVTSKLIDIRAAVVEARSSDFVAGSTKVLLKSLPVIVDKLFKGGGMSSMRASKHRRVTTKKQGSSEKDIPSVNYTNALLAKEQMRKGHLIMGVGGLLSSIALIGMYSAASAVEPQCLSCNSRAHSQMKTYLVTNVLGLAASAFGATKDLYGRALKTTNRLDVVGTSHYLYIGGVLSVLGSIASYTTIEDRDPKHAPHLATATAALGMGFFAAASVSSVARTAKGERLLAIGPTLLPGRKKQVPGMALAMRF